MVGLKFNYFFFYIYKFILWGFFVANCPAWTLQKRDICELHLFRPAAYRDMSRWHGATMQLSFPSYHPKGNR